MRDYESTKLLASTSIINGIVIRRHIMKRILSVVFGLLAVPPAHGFLTPVPTTSHHAVIPASNNVINQRLHLAAAFASSSRRFFTPKEDGGAAADDKPFIRPAIHNSPFFRSLAILYALLFAIYQGTTPSAVASVGKHLILSPKAAATIHLLSFGTWFGTVVYTTFIAGITMFKVSLINRLLSSYICSMFFLLSTTHSLWS